MSDSRLDPNDLDITVSGNPSDDEIAAIEEVVTRYIGSSREKDVDAWKLSGRLNLEGKPHAEIDAWKLSGRQSRL